MKQTQKIHFGCNRYITSQFTRRIHASSHDQRPPWLCAPFQVEFFDENDLKNPSERLPRILHSVKFRMSTLVEFSVKKQSFIHLTESQLIDVQYSPPFNEVDKLVDKETLKSWISLQQINCHAERAQPNSHVSCCYVQERICCRD